MGIIETIEKSLFTIAGLIFIDNFGARLIDPNGDKLLHEMFAEKSKDLGSFVHDHVRINIIP